MKIWVTGASGFLGQHVVRELRTNNEWKVRALSKRGRSWGVAKSTGLDLTAPGALHKLRNAGRTRQGRNGTQDLSPRVIVHCAARCGGIGINAEQPGTFFGENMRMGLAVAEYAVECDAHLIFIGTTCSYPSRAKVPFTENALGCGIPEPTNAAYGMAKLALLWYLDGLGHERGLRWTYLIPTNLYGPGDNFDLDTSHVIPAVIRKFIRAQNAGDEAVELWGDGSPTRDFLYVEDAAKAIYRAVEEGPQYLPINLGSGQEWRISDVVDMVATALDFRPEIRWDTSRPGGQERRKLETSLAKELYGWEATTDLPTGIMKTIRWYLQRLQTGERA